MKKNIIFLLLIFSLLAGSSWGLSLANTGSTTLLRRTVYDLYGSQGSYSPVYELVNFDWQGKENLSGSVYLRGRAGNVYYSDNPTDLLVYSAFADWKVNDNLTLRGGRQIIYQDIRVFSLDGVKVDIPTFLRPNVAVSAYMGRPANNFAADPGTNLLGFRTLVAVRENATIGVDYQAEQKGGNNLSSVGGVKASATLGKMEVGALANYDMMRSVVKNYNINASLPIREGMVLQGKYDGQTPDFDPQSVYAVFKYAYQQVQHASAGVEYGLNDKTNIYTWLGTIAQDNAKGYDWRVGLANTGGLLGYDTAIDIYKTQGLDGEREDWMCSAARQVSDKLKLAGRVNYDVFSGDRVLTGGLDATFKPSEVVDLNFNYQTVLGGFTPNSKLLASASFNLGE